MAEIFLNTNLYLPCTFHNFFIELSIFVFWLILLRNFSLWKIHKCTYIALPERRYTLVDIVPPKKQSKFKSEFGRAITIPFIILIFVCNLIPLHTNRTFCPSNAHASMFHQHTSGICRVQRERTVLQHEFLFPHLPLASFASRPSASTTVTWSTTMGGYNIENMKKKKEKNVKTKFI